VKKGVGKNNKMVFDSGDWSPHLRFQFHSTGSTRTRQSTHLIDYSFFFFFLF